jgi:uncharacterized protein YjiS (DUF1127 family)
MDLGVIGFGSESGGQPMNALIRTWLKARRYRAALRQLTSLSPADLNALGIAPTEIDRLAREVSRAD